MYRKYRPRLLGDLLGQETIVHILGNAAKQERLAHAYLFYGPKGTGKTTTARIVAKIANCEKRASDKKFREKGEPCNTCRPCTEIDTGHALDVIEIDAASNRGIDEIRSLKESIKLSPTSYSHKVFIIDEAHQLTKEAFNALLKTLEEPPEHVIFILATTEYEKVPATISSRTQRFHFKKLSLPEIVSKLKTIVKAEKLAIDDDALELIASSAEGSVRDAESLLDQLTSLENTVHLESVEHIIGKIGFKRIAELVDAILDNDLKKSLTFINTLHTDGYNVVDLTKELIHYLRRVISLSCDETLISLFSQELTERELTFITEHSKKVNLEKHIPLIRSLIEAYSQMRYSPFVTIPLEVTLIEHLQKKGY